MAFFAVMYYTALRPEEAVNLRKPDITLPPLTQNPQTKEMEEPADAWGEPNHAGAGGPKIGGTRRRMGRAPHTPRCSVRRPRLDR